MKLSKFTLKTEFPTKSNKNKKALSKGAKIGLVFAAVLIGLYVLIYVIPKVSDIFESTYIAEFGTVETGITAECVIVRHETNYKTNSAGKIEKVVPEGGAVRAKTLIAKLDGSEMVSSDRGIVSYHFDNYSDQVNPDTMANLTKDFLNEYKSKESKVYSVGNSLEEPGIGFRIIDNHEWYLVCWITEEETKKFSEGKRVYAVMESSKQGLSNSISIKKGNSQIAENNDVRVAMTVRSITKQKSDYQLILSCNSNYDDFDKYRVKTVDIISSSASGIVVDTKSIVAVDGKDGVYRIDKYGESNFVPVLILAQFGDTTVVEKNFFYGSDGWPVLTVENYDEILKNGKKEALSENKEVS